jgi:HK97 family phage major capsid protein
MATLIFAGEDVHQLTSERQEHVSRLTQMLKTSSAESRDLTQSEKREWDLSMNEITHLSDKILRLRAEYPDLPETASRNTAIADMCRALYWTSNGQNDKRFPTRDFTLSGTTATIQNPRISQEFFLALQANNPLASLGARFMVEPNFTQFPVQTAKPTVSWFEEGDTMTPDSSATIGSKKATFRVPALLFKSSNFWLEDSGPIGAEIISAMALQAINEAIIKVAINGASASGQPVGLDNLSGVQTVDGGNVEIEDWSKITDCVTKLLSADVPLDRVGWLYPPKVWQQINKIVGDDLHHVLPPSGLANIPGFVTSAIPTATITGTPTTYETTAYFGDWSNMLVVSNGGPSIQILRERYADDMATGFLVWLRMDITVIRPNNFCILQNIATTA